MDVKGRKARRRARGDDGDLHGVFAAQANRQDSHVHPPPLPASAPVLPTSNVSDAPGTPSVAAPPTPVPGTAMVAAPATPVPPVPATPSVAAPATPAERSKATSARIRVSRAPAPHVATPAAPSVAPVAAAAPRPAPATPAQPLPAPAAPAPSVAAPGTPAPSAPATPMSHAPAIVGTSAKSKARPPPPSNEEHVSEQLSDDDWNPSHLLSDGEEAESLQSDGEEAEPEVAPADEEENGLTCGICLQPHGKEAVESLECGHVFHSACLDTWFRTAEPTPDPHACPNRCHTFLRRQHVSPTLAEE